MASTPSREEEAVEELVANAIDAYESGGEAGLAEFLRSLDKHAGAVASKVESLRELGLLGSPTEKKLERLGDFRLVELLGAGGMGIVYRAIQESLGREVAVKIIRPEHVYFPGARQRFRREVEIIARLQHPGIVPIYSVGDEGGVPYFAMELLDGLTLESLVRKLDKRSAAELQGRDLAPDAANPGYLFEGTWEQGCLRVVRQVAEALRHAHDRGVVHRDIKPSNVLVTKDGSGRVVLLDFGLAGSNATGKLTKTGARMGSLQYMSPEQTRGESSAVGPASDIYSLGVVLYELLTLRPAFHGRSESEIARAIERGTPVAPRTVNPKLSWEAETVCLTAMDPEIGRRYASAADFCRDLDNVLAGRPVEARRTGALRRTWKWVQRNPAVAAALTLAGLLVVGVPTGYAWEERRTSIAIGEQRDRAERNFARAQTAVDRMLSRLGSVDLRFVPQMEPIRKAVLEDALALLGEFVKDEGSTDESKLQVAKAHSRLGNLYLDLGRQVEAAAAFGQAFQAYEALTDRFGNEPEFRKMQFKSLLSQGVAYANAGRPKDAIEIVGKLTSRLDAMALPAEAKPWLERMRIETLLLRSHALTFEEHGIDAKECTGEATRRADELVRQYPNDTESLMLAQSAWNSHGNVLLQFFTPEGKGSPESEAALLRTVELSEAFVKSKDATPNHRQMLAIAESNLAGAYRRAEKFAPAEEMYARARQVLEGLVGQYPDTLGYKLDLATVCNQIALLLEYEKKSEGVEDAYRRTVDLLQELTVKAPDDATLWARLGTARSNLGSPHLSRSDFEGTEKLLVGAIDALRHAVALAPGNKESIRELVNNGKHLAYVRRLQKNHAGAAAIVEEIMRELPNEPYAAQTAAVQIALGVPVVNDLTDLDDKSREALRLDYARRVAEAVREVLRRGGQTPPNLRSMKDFKPLHGLAPFEELADESEARAKK